MKKLILLVSSIALLGSNATFAKDKDIFKEHGFNKAPLTLSNGRFNEFFKNEEVVQIGTVLLNTKTNKVVAFLEEDTTKTKYLAEFSSRWLSPDPLAEKYYSVSPYVYCHNNPVNRIDPDGRADFWNEKGKVIGNDGVDNNKVYVIRKEALSKEDYKTTTSFIKANKGNAKAFSSNETVYTNSIEIEGSSSARQAMVTEISKDNGSGGTKDANNREYGGTVKNGVVTTATPGDVANPKTDATASITLPSGSSTFHSHPSGEIVDGSPIGTLGGSTTTHYFTQSPSTLDVSTAGSSTHYVYGRSDNNVYIYNEVGVQVVIPMKNFVNPKK